MNPELCVYTVNKQQLYAKVAGKSNRQIALLIHGWSSTWFAMSPLLPVFSKRFRAVAGDLRHRLGQIDIPALAIWGLEDNTVPLSDASALHEEWPDINLRIIPNAGHWPHFEIPQVTRRYIEGFLGTPVNLLNLLSNL